MPIGRPNGTTLREVMKATGWQAHSREFGVQVWATDLWFNVSENIQRIRDAGVEDGVFPIHADARSLPFAREFFDAVVSIPLSITGRTTCT